MLVPALVFLFGLSQHQAQGTTLALLVPPLGAFAAWAYWLQGYVDLRLAGLLAVGFVVGALLGSKLSLGMSNPMLQRIFGSAMFLLGLKMLLSAGN